MKIAAVSDIHLGKKSFTAVIEGRNAREVDIEKAWFAAILAIVKAKVDLVVIPGDIFDHLRVTDYAKRSFLIGLRQIVESGARLIVEQGNHEGARTRDVLTPLMLAEGWFDQVHIITTPKVVKFEVGTEKVSVSCFPFVALEEVPAYRLDPDPDADVNILAMHAAVRGHATGDKLPWFYGAGDQALDVGREVDKWDAIICGDYHEFTRLHPTAMAFYPGALERTTSNIWAETEPKGWVLCDTATGTMEFQEVATRPMYDYSLADFDLLPGATAMEVNICLAILTERSFLKDAIVRFKVEDFPKEERNAIDWGIVRSLKSECLSFDLDTRYQVREVEDLGDRRERKTTTLAEEAVAFTKDDDPEVRSMFLSYLDVIAEAEDVGEVAV